MKLQVTVGVVASGRWDPTTGTTPNTNHAPETLLAKGVLCSICEPMSDVLRQFVGLTDHLMVYPRLIVPLNLQSYFGIEVVVPGELNIGNAFPRLELSAQYVVMNCAGMMIPRCPMPEEIGFELVTTSGRKHRVRGTNDAVTAAS